MPNNALAQEIIPAHEIKDTRDLAARLQAKNIRDNPTGIMRGDAHPKMHGLVKAEFIIEPDLPAILQVGIFSETRTYQAWIRFSNQDGNTQPDTSRDIRGMAIKLMGVAGDKLLEAKSPFRKVATIRIPQQEFDSEAQCNVGENLSFTSWYSLPAHRPLGGINRARKIVYDAISSFRRARNNVPRQEPTSWEI